MALSKERETEMSELAAALQREDVARTIRLLDQLGSEVYVDKNSDLPLIYCIRHNHRAIIKTLLQYGLSQDQRNRGLEFALSRPERDFSLSVVEELIKAGAFTKYSCHVKGCYVEHVQNPMVTSRLMEVMCRAAATSGGETMHYITDIFINMILGDEIQSKRHFSLSVVEELIKAGPFIKSFCHLSRNFHLRYNYNPRIINQFMEVICRAAATAGGQTIHYINSLLMNIIVPKYVFSSNLMNNFKPEDQYKVIQSLLKHGLDCSKFWNKQDKNDMICYVRDHGMTSMAAILSLMIRMSVERTVQENSFLLHFEHLGEMDAQEFFPLLTLLHYCGHSILARYIAQFHIRSSISPALKRHCSELLSTPRGLLHLAAVKLRHTLPPPNILYSLKKADVPQIIVEEVCMTNLDVTNSLEPHKII